MFPKKKGLVLLLLKLQHINKFRPGVPDLILGIAAWKYG